jgi:hypothetical protein
MVEHGLEMRAWHCEVIGNRIQVPIALIAHDQTLIDVEHANAHGYVAHGGLEKLVLGPQLSGGETRPPHLVAQAIKLAQEIFNAATRVWRGAGGGMSSAELACLGEEIRHAAAGSQERTRASRKHTSEAIQDA